jgi:hypothetical protein
VLVVDEAGMVSGRQMEGLLKLAKREDARILFSGDTRQLQSVEASDYREKLREMLGVSTTRPCGASRKPHIAGFFRGANVPPTLWQRSERNSLFQPSLRFSQPFVAPLDRCL